MSTVKEHTTAVQAWLVTVSWWLTAIYQQQVYAVSIWFDQTLNGTKTCF